MNLVFACRFDAIGGFVYTNDKGHDIEYTVSASSILMFLKIVLDLIIQLRKALKVNMTTNSVEVKVHISARYRYSYMLSYNTT
jgi:hypothetical protein